MATKGPTLPASWGLTWWDHLKTLAIIGLLLLAAGATILYTEWTLRQLDPDYGQDYSLQRAFCLETGWQWDEVGHGCRPIKAEAAR